MRIFLLILQLLGASKRWFRSYNSYLPLIQSS
jgi:hypothetical protein